MPNPRAVQANDPAYLKAAFSLLGLSEIEGAQHEKRVLAMYAASGHPEIHDDETPWCAAFAGDCLKQGGLVGTHSLMARSYATYGKHLDPEKTIPRGAIAVWTRDGGGHVNFVLADDGEYVTCIGGNQSNGKGGGVTISRRKKSEAVAFRMPAGVVVVAKAVPVPKPKPQSDVTPEVIQPDDPGVEETPPKDTPPKDMGNLKGSRTMAGGATASAGTAGTVAAEAAQTIEPIADYSQAIKFIFIGLTFVGIAIMIYARWDDAGRPLPWGKP